MSDWNISFIKQCWRYRHSGEASVGHQYSYTQMHRWAGIFQKLRDPIVMTLLAPREECNLDFSPKSCAYPTLSTIDPLEVKIISISLFNVNFDFSWSFNCHNVTSQRDIDLTYLTLAIFGHEIFKPCYNYLIH